MYASVASAYKESEHAENAHAAFSVDGNAADGGELLLVADSAAGKPTNEVGFEHDVSPPPLLRRIPFIVATLNVLLVLVALTIAVLCYTDIKTSLASLTTPALASSSSIPALAAFNDSALLSSQRGHIALVYSGTLRSFSSCFHSHLLNIIASSPFTVHLFLQADIVDESELARFNATVDYYSGWYDADNTYIPIRHAIKAIQFSPRSNLTTIAQLYEQELIVIEKDWTDTEPVFVFAQLESMRLANEMRLEYERSTNVSYIHVFRMRYDMTFKTPVWDTVFRIEPRDIQLDLVAEGPGHVAERWEAAINNTYVLYDTVYKYNVDSSQLIVPGCDRYNGGYNDQFSISNSTVMSLICNRGHDSAVFATDTKEDPWRFHSESFFRRVMEFHGLGEFVPAEQCHSKLQQDGPICGVNGYGKGCCEYYCPIWRAMEKSRTERLRPYNTLPSYVAHFPPQWNLTVGSSSYQLFWRHRRPEHSVACLLDEEQRKAPMEGMLPQPDPYFHLILPYITRQYDQLQRFIALDVCPPS